MNTQTMRRVEDDKEQNNLMNVRKQELRAGAIIFLRLCSTTAVISLKIQKDLSHTEYPNDNGTPNALCVV